MDTSQNEIVAEQNNETTIETTQEVGTSKESANATCEDLKSVESAREKLEDEENSLNMVAEQVVEVANDKNCPEIDSVQKDNEEIGKEETAKTGPKEVIEILNVELVVPGSGDGTSNDVSEVDKNIVENADHKQAENETFLEGTKMNTIEINVDPTPGENQNLTSSSEKSTDPTKTSGLGLLSQYQSDDDADSVVEVPLTAAQDYRNQVLEIDSDSDSDGSSSSSDVEYLNKLRKTIEKRIEIADEDEGEDEDQEDGTGKRRPRQKLRVKGELLLEDLPPIQDLQITVPEDDCIEFGKIHSVVDQLVLVSTLPNSILLDLETVIFLEKGQRVLGEVFDVLGQVADPLYCVRFNSNKQIKEKQIKIGDVVYVAPKTQYTQYVILSNLMKTKGSDASWENDMEPPPRFLDYSDDEQEQLARRQLRNKDRPNDNEDANKKPRTGDNDGSMSTSSAHHPNQLYRNRSEQRSSRESPASPSNIRPRYNGPHQNQQRAPNYHRSSWHSNYNPNNFPTQPNPSNFRMHLPQNHAHSHQAFHPNMPVYGMPGPQNMPYPPVQPPPYGVPHNMYHQYPQQLMPPTLHGPPPHAPRNHQYISTPPPPPGSQ